MMPIEAPRQRWMNWSETIARPSKIAAALGINEAELVHWLDNAAPPGGGKLRGAHIRWATDDETAEGIAQEKAELAEEAAALAKRWIRWSYPDGTHECLSMTAAAKRLVNDETNRPATAAKLAAQLLKLGGVLYQDGHTLEPVDPPPPPRKPDGRRREARAKRMTEHQTTSDEPTTEEEPEMSDQQHHGRSGQHVQVGDLCYPSLNSAAAALGCSSQGLANKLRRHPEGCEVKGQLVQLSGSTSTPATTVKAARKGNARLALGSSAAALLEQTAADAGLSPDDALMALLPPSEAMAAVLDSIDRERLAELTDLDWQRLQAIARVSGGEG